MASIREYIKSHKNLDLLVSGIALVYVWRGIWSLTDMFTISGYEYNRGDFLSYLIPMVVAMAYFYWNDHKFKELIHTN